MSSSTPISVANQEGYPQRANIGVATPVNLVNADTRKASAIRTASTQLTMIRAFDISSPGAYQLPTTICPAELNLLLSAHSLFENVVQLKCVRHAQQRRRTQSEG